ncbi:hypothetical protein CAPTEDRAFT_204045 [Capitella teleta]|uniref:Uncharacterized protein n=1 Tax=Capitella teleta TaxID=283909 RepID=R7TTR4_CAPTE|nr:hypothetical protein CAPTEDRAFT_204045 [Capitella teleta]|eukprot:ELT94400.1 hypothetical protein CAPTEDRAFT_204045 [Capitella teleta]
MTATHEGSAILFQPGWKANNLSLGKWLKAFFVYFIVYIRRYPNEATNLIKYADTIRELHATGAIWAYYDDNITRLGCGGLNTNKTVCNTARADDRIGTIRVQLSGVQQQHASLSANKNQFILKQSL